MLSLFLALQLSVYPATDVVATSYNPHFSQTDNSPCIGASGVDLCYHARNGRRIIALSQNLVGRAAWKPFRYGETVYLQSDCPGASGEFIVLDTMNERFRDRVDIFSLKRENNIGKCPSTLYKTGKAIINL